MQATATVHSHDSVNASFPRNTTCPASGRANSGSGRGIGGFRFSFLYCRDCICGGSEAGVWVASSGFWRDVADMGANDGSAGPGPIATGGAGMASDL